MCEVDTDNQRLNKYFRQDSIFRISFNDEDKLSNDNEYVHMLDTNRNSNEESECSQEILSASDTGCKTIKQSNEFTCAPSKTNASSANQNQFYNATTTGNEDSKEYDMTRSTSSCSLASLVLQEKRELSSVTNADEGSISSCSSSTGSGSHITHDNIKRQKYEILISKLTESLKHAMTLSDRNNMILESLYTKTQNTCRCSMDDGTDGGFIEISNNIIETTLRNEPEMSLVEDNTEQNKTWRKSRSLFRRLFKRQMARTGKHLYYMVSKFLPARQQVSSILSNPEGSMWVAFQNSEVIKLYDYHGNALDAINVKAVVDDLALSNDGKLYISCPNIKCIKVLTSDLKLQTFVTTPTFVRGLCLNPLNGFLMACLVPTPNHHTQHHDSQNANIVQYPTYEFGNMRRKSNNMVDKDGICVNCGHFANSNVWDSHLNGLQSEGKKCMNHTPSYSGSKFADDGIFQYPIRLVVNAKGELLVSDVGRKSLFILSPDGSLLRDIHISQWHISCRHSLAYDVSDDSFVIVQSGNRNLIKVRIHFDDSISARPIHVEELEAQNVAASCIDKRGIIIVSVGKGFIKVLTKSLDCKMKGSWTL